MKALLENGFSQEEVSFITGDRRDQPAVGPVETAGADSEAGRDAWIGGVVGLAAGTIAAVIPGIGPLLMIGPLAGAIGGMSVGAAAGGIIGLLKDHGISEEEAQFFAEGVKRGGALVVVHGVSEDREKKARQIMKDRQAIDTEELADQQPKVRRAG